MKDKRKIFFLIFLVLFVLAIDGLLFYQYRLHKADKANERLQDLSSTEDTESADAQEVSEEEPLEEEEEKATMLVRSILIPSRKKMQTSMPGFRSKIVRSTIRFYRVPWMIRTIMLTIR